jgi:diadenosine tetraphosphatase ApaH/serine/threonine PP2A family protein phosphatase
MTSNVLYSQASAAIEVVVRSFQAERGSFADEIWEHLEMILNELQGATWSELPLRTITEDPFIACHGITESQLSTMSLDDINAYVARRACGFINGNARFLLEQSKDPSIDERSQSYLRQMSTRLLEVHMCFVHKAPSGLLARHSESRDGLGRVHLHETLSQALTRLKLSE